jgi:AraC-like DNA-binding protein
VKEDFINYKHEFVKLSNLLYREFYINGYCIKVLGIHYMDYACNWSVKTHKHTFFELHYIVDGSVATTINGIEKRLYPGEFYLMPPNTFHSHKQDFEETHLGLALRWEMLKTSKEIHEKSTNDMDMMLKVLSRFQWDKKTDNGDVYNKFIEIIKNATNSSSLKLQLLFLEFLECMQQFYIDNKVDLISNHYEENRENNKIASSAIRFIDENYMLDIDMKDVANHVHISYSQLSRIFKKQNEITINNYLNKVRLSEAQKLLKCTNESINLITQRVGFNSEYYFSNAFKRVVGISPREYRKKFMYLDE